jgi:hypothetical protein
MIGTGGRQHPRFPGVPCVLDPFPARRYIRRMIVIGLRYRLRRRTAAPAPVRDRC